MITLSLPLHGKQTVVTMFPGSTVKNPPANAEDTRDAGSIPGSGRSPGGGYGNPLQYSCLENSMDKRVWWATVHRVLKSRTQLKQLGTRDRSTTKPKT